ncbi:MAG: prepilin-type N-terminal cleavage/methylation domain-containing protein [Clostridia bacterium]
MMGVQKKQNSRINGFTLVELIVTLAILTILTVGLAAITPAALNTARLSITLSEDRMIAQTIMEQLAREIACAQDGDVVIGTDGATIEFTSKLYGRISVSTSGGRVHVMGGENEMGLEDKAYMQRTASATFTSLSGGFVNIKVKIARAQEQSYETERLIKLINTK